PDTLYAIVEAKRGKGGLYRSTNGGASWQKRDDYVSGSPQYYQEIVADPAEVGRVYSMDTWMMVTTDGGKTFQKVGEKTKHVDNHVLWIDPDDTQHLIAGCDGGVYDSFDRGVTWRFTANLPVTQFYDVTVDDSQPFYNVYGGTQDNFTLGGPSRTTTMHGIRNADWFVTVGGDGFQSQVDPKDPAIVYSEYQYGGLVRFDRRSGETIDIQPQPEVGDEPLKWNWDSALLISPHDHKRLYFGANRLFRSDDRGDTWRAVSPDLTRGIDRNKLKVMGRVWSVDAVAKNASTSFYGTIVALAESPLEEGLIYAGTDDGLIQVTENGGKNWRKIDRIRGVPERAYVSHILASPDNADTVLASFDNHKEGDFKPYLMVSKDRGHTWDAIASDLPERGQVHAIEQDRETPSLLFAGTEFGVYFTVDAGEDWIRLEGDMPIIAVRSLAIQRRENDLVVGTFGRGFFILDDYTPLRTVTEQQLEQEALLFPPKDAWMYFPSTPLGLPGKSFQGDAYYTAENPPFGAIFTYYLKDGIKTRKEKRRQAEKKIAKEGGDVFYPTWEDLRAEEREEKPAVLLTVSDEEGHVVRHVTGPVDAGFHRVSWDLRYPASNPTELKPPSDYNPFRDKPAGPMVAPGRYWVSLAKRVGGTVTPLAEARPFRAVPLGLGTLAARDREAVVAFQKKIARLQRAVLGAVRAASEAQDHLKHLQQALLDTSGADPALGQQARELEERLKDLLLALRGDPVVRKHHEPTLPSIVDRVQRIISGQWSSTSAPTATQRRAYEIAAGQFQGVLRDLRSLIELDLQRLEEHAEAAGAPWTPGRVPRWRPE
ncbi:MAG: WD40/YVTN/BNR-like repeat-containing protein, partial [Acidobacteriota bacterium]